MNPTSRERTSLADSVLDSALDGVCAFDARGLVTLWNRALERLTGRSAPSVIGRPLVQSLDLLADHEGRALLEAALAGREGVSRAKPRREPGATRFFDIHSSPLSEPEGPGSGLLVLREVTEAHQFRELLLESEERFRTMADCSPVLLWMAGADARCTFFNASWLQFTGRPLARELGFGWAESVAAEDLEDCLETFMDAFSERRPFRMEYRLRRHDGVQRWILDTGVPRCSPEGLFLGYIGSCIDITELRESRVALERSLREKEVLLREVHHRVKNNLQLVSSLLSLAAADAHDGARDALRESLNRVRAMALVHDALYRSQSLGAVEFGGYVRRTAEAVRASYQREGHRLEIAVAAEELQLPLDVAIPCGLLLNELVANAFKHAFPGARPGTIRVGLERGAGRWATLCVADDGIGMGAGASPPAQVGFELVRDLVGQFGGRIEVDGTAGTRVTVAIPLVEGNAP